MAAVAEAGRLNVVTSLQMAEIKAEHVELLHAERALRLRNDAVIINAVGILPSAFLRSIGIDVQTKHGTA